MLLVVEILLPTTMIRSVGDVHASVPDASLSASDERPEVGLDAGDVASKLTIFAFMHV